MASFFGADKKDFNGYLTDEEYELKVNQLKRGMDAKIARDEERVREEKEKLFNYVFVKLFNIPEFRKQFVMKIITGTNFSKEEAEQYFKQVI